MVPARPSVAASTTPVRPFQAEAPQIRGMAHEIDPTLYLKRMLEYEVTHENGFLAVNDACQQQLVVELYQLESGWTVFGHYGEREEKVDRAELDEFTELAQRLAFALLRGRPVGQTITRENVLRSDSERDCAPSRGRALHLRHGDRGSAGGSCRPRKGSRCRRPTSCGC